MGQLPELVGHRLAHWEEGTLVSLPLSTAVQPPVLELVVCPSCTVLHLTGGVSAV